MTQNIINKVVITAEAKFDFEQVLDLGKMPKAEMQYDIEEYIDIKNKDGRMLATKYFRVKYIDERSGEMLMLFIYRSKKMRCMQHWKVKGICIAENWTVEDEESGAIKNWINSTITDMPKEQDWVEKHRIWKEEQKRLQKELDKKYGQV